MPDEEQGTVTSKGVLDALRNAVEAMKERKRIYDSVELSNGVVLKLRDIPQAILRRALSAVKEPRVPIVFLEDKGREEENPNDPAYIEAMNNWHNERLETYYKIVLSLGTQLKSVPEVMYGPEDDGWVEEVRFASDNKIEPDLSLGITRYYDWLQYYVLADEIDRNAVIAATYHRNGGVQEQEVAEAWSWFRSQAQRSVDSKPAKAEGRENRDRVRGDGSGDGAGTGGAGSSEAGGVHVEAVAEAGTRGKSSRNRPRTPRTAD